MLKLNAHGLALKRKLAVSKDTVYNLSVIHEYIQKYYDNVDDLEEDVYDCLVVIVYMRLVYEHMYERRIARVSSEVFFTQGGCYLLASIASTFFTNASVYKRKNVAHCGFGDKNNIFDVRGICNFSLFDEASEDVLDYMRKHYTPGRLLGRQIALIFMRQYANYVDNMAFVHEC